MKTILFALLGLFLITIIPVYAQEPSFDDRLVSSEEYTKLVTSDYILEQKINELQKTNLELNSKIDNLTSQIIDLKDNGIKFGIDEEKLGQAITNNQKTDNGWTTGDVLVGSTTIFAFFTFSSFLVIRFESKFRDRLVNVTKDIMLATLGIQFFQILIILSIVGDRFDLQFYTIALISTLIFLIMIVINVSRIITAENKVDKRKEEGLKVTLDLKSEIEKLGITQDTNTIHTRLDSLEREYKKIQRERGE